MLKTNGKRIAHDDRFLAEFNEARPSIYFQFDGFDSETYRIIRGEPDILAENCARSTASPTSAHRDPRPAIERGVNENEIGKIIDFASTTRLSTESTFNRPSMRAAICGTIPCNA